MPETNGNENPVSPNAKKLIEIFEDFAGFISEAERRGAQHQTPNGQKFSKLQTAAKF